MAVPEARVTTWRAKAPPGALGQRRGLDSGVDTRPYYRAEVTPVVMAVTPGCRSAAGWARLD